MEYMSQEGYDVLMSELQDLIKVQYPKNRDELSEARAQGDLSENAEYRSARRAQAHILSRIRFLQNVLDNARVIDMKNLSTEKIGLLSKVTFTNLANNTQMTFKIVSPHEANLEQRMISFKSPIGQALLGHKVGETVDAQTPAATLKLRIEKITLD